MEMQSLVFAQLVFSLDSVQYFLIMLPFLHFGMAKYILNVIFFFIFIFMAGYVIIVKRSQESPSLAEMTRFRFSEEICVNKQGRQR